MTHGDFVNITNDGTADVESAAATLNVTPGAVITKIVVQDLTVGHTYAVQVSFPGAKTPQKYLVPSNGAAATNGGKLVPGAIIDCKIPVPTGLSSVSITSWADVASATVSIGFMWEKGESGQTYSDFTKTTSAGTSETLIGTISIAGGATIKKIVVASRLGVGLLKSVRLDYSGIETPHKYLCTPMIYDSVGTEVQNAAIIASPTIDVDVKVPGNTNSISIYGTSQTASNTVAVALVWV